MKESENISNNGENSWRGVENVENIGELALITANPQWR
jgi:hypothetical protein